MLGRSLIALDEPTTGMSARESVYLIEALQKLSQEKIGIIASIHQPRSDVLKLFDYVLVLCKGEMVYFGRRQDMLPYFLPFSEKLEINIDQMNQEQFVCKFLFLIFISFKFLNFFLQIT